MAYISRANYEPMLVFENPIAHLNRKQRFTEPQIADTVDIPASSNVILDFNTFNNCSIDVTRAMTFGVPINMVPGQTGYIILKQGSTVYSISFDSSIWKTFNGAPIMIDLKPNTYTVVSYLILSTSTICVSIGNSVNV